MSDTKSASPIIRHTNIINWRQTLRPLHSVLRLNLIRYKKKKKREKKEKKKKQDTADLNLNQTKLYNQL